MPRLIRTPAAEADLLEIAYYIAVEQGRPQTAEKVIDDLIAKCGEYAASPRIGEAKPALGADYRVFHFKRWVVIYRSFADGIRSDADRRRRSRLSPLFRPVRRIVNRAAPTYPGSLNCHKTRCPTVSGWTS